MQLSVIIPAHNPDPARLRRVLSALQGQSLPGDGWETVLVDNASVPPLTVDGFASGMPADLRIVREPEPGLTLARRRGFTEARGEFLVLVDDDNVLAPDYLDRTLQLFAKHPAVGALGGRSRPEFAVVPPAWVREFDGLLALRDLGDAPLLSTGSRPPGTARATYPPFSPIGAGMALRRAAVEPWLASFADHPWRAALDRRGTTLVSGGDNDLVFAVLEAGWEVAYFPELVLTHLIPPERLSGDYLARLNRAMQESWMHVLSRHEANPWPPLTAIGAKLRRLKAWLTYHPWTSPASRVRFAGACGHFAGRVIQPD